MICLKKTDSVYLEKRNIPKEYNPLSTYDFPSWNNHFDNSIRSIYEHMHETLLYTDEKQSFDKALQVFDSIDQVLSEIGE